MRDENNAAVQENINTLKEMDFSESFFDDEAPKADDESLRQAIRFLVGETVKDTRGDDEGPAPAEGPEEKRVLRARWQKHTGEIVAFVPSTSWDAFTGESSCYKETFSQTRKRQSPSGEKNSVNRKKKFKVTGTCEYL